MVEKRFALEEIHCFDYGIKVMDIIKDNGIELSQSTVCDLLNQLLDENEQLKKEKEFWKSDNCSLSNLNSILSNELSIAEKQGYEPSKSYKEYVASIKTEYDKFWENKIKTHNNRLNGVKE